MSVPFLDLLAGHNEIRDQLDPIWTTAIDNDDFIGGNNGSEFEQAFAQACNVEVAVGVANGTDALELILRAAGIGPGDEVIVPANTFVATAEAVVLAGATPRFCDVDPATLLITSETAEAVRTNRTAAVIAVHLFGQMVDCDDLLGWSSRHGLALIEDAAQAHLASWKNDLAGSVGLAAGFSFYPGKNLGALGDGGAVTTNDVGLANTIRTLANHGRSKDHHDHTLVGRNSRLDAIQAAALTVKLGSVNQWNTSRREHWDSYLKGLASLQGLIRPVETRPQGQSAVHLAVVEVPNREQLQKALRAKGIGTGIHYPLPCHLHPAFIPWNTGPLEVAEAAAERILSLPMYPQLTSADTEAVCEAIIAFYRS